jgi:hypothetical protein
MHDMNLTIEPLPIRPGTIAELGVYADFWVAMFEEVGVLSESDMRPEARALPVVFRAPHRQGRSAVLRGRRW